MANLEFINADCGIGAFNKIVFVRTPTIGLNYIDYIFGNIVKDFKDIKQYRIHHSRNCSGDDGYIPVPPNYVFSLTKLSCSTVTSGINLFIKYLIFMSITHRKNLMSTHSQKNLVSTTHTQSMSCSKVQL